MLPKIRLIIFAYVVGCGAPYGSVADSAISSAIVANNSVVDILNRVQSSAIAQRKSVLVAIAKTAESKEAGEKKIEDTVANYAAVFEAFKTAEGIQNALADALLLARSAIDAGKSPDLSRVIRLYGDLQKAHSSIMLMMASIK